MPQPHEQPLLKASGGVAVTGSDGPERDDQAVRATADKTLNDCPNELLILIVDNIRDTPSLAALASTCRRLEPIANPALYKIAAADANACRIALQFAVENGHTRSATILLENGGNPN
ncbi:hypothetical protein OQA88_3053 [Cercophora sp. LCS_1]